MRELQAVAYDSSVYTDENLLYKSGLIDQVSLSKNLTYLWGKTSDMFPLLTNTQAQNAFKSVKPQALNDTQYTWPVMGRTKWTTNVVGLVNTGLTTPGKNFALFDVIFEDNWIHAQYSAYTPDRKNIVRFMTEPKQIGPKRYVVTVQLITGDATEYVDPTNFEAGKAWGQGSTSVAGQLSDGTTNNRMTPGKLTNQFGYQRYSQNITGNIANKVVNIEFDLEEGGTTSYWMPFEMKQWEMERRYLDEIDLWDSVYNRDSNGVIHLKDLETGLPIPKGAGVKQQIKAAGNYDTFGILTKAKFDGTIRSVFTNRIDDTPSEITLYTGLGGAEMFHNMLMTEAKDYVVSVGDKVVTGDGYLQYGAYFNRYKTIDNRIITVQVSKMFDHGVHADMDRANGRTYNNLPWSSYTLAFLDHSLTNGGERNIMLVYEEGREEIVGVYRGMTNIPASWKAMAGVSVDNTKIPYLSTTQDKASFEVFTSRGINIMNAQTCFLLEMSL